MTNKLQGQFNLAGTKGKTTVKQPIQDLNIYKAVIGKILSLSNNVKLVCNVCLVFFMFGRFIILGAVKRVHSNATDCEVRSFVASTLKYAPYRLDGGKRKTSAIGGISNEDEEHSEVEEKSGGIKKCNSYYCVINFFEK